MHSVPYAKETLVMLVGYALGCFTSGYYLVRWRTGEDIRWLGSGSVGATNVGRVLGRPGFFLTVLCDFFKGLFAVWLAGYFRLNPTGAVLTMVAVAIGHIWPAQLWFHGGKGVATSLGALLMFDYSIAFTFAALFLVVCAALRNFVLAGLVAFALTPLALFAADYSLTSVFGVSALALLILIAHRKNVPDEIHKLMTGRKLKSDKRAVPK
ncbi:MAG: glycerol-3-phosphate acyltransferase [Verrucomicrobia bacterium]|nr:MAG: glycerol-3-phosphate acyltransferase [Verrucomicrobiota bacterium]